jgi:capsular exopolysaccharide synthesis family protein
LRKQKRVIVTSVAVIGGLVLAACLIATPKYRSVATVEVNKENADALGLDSYDRAPVAESPDSLEAALATQTEASILRSDALALQVTEQLGIEKRKEFALKPGLFNRASTRAAIEAELKAPLEKAPRRRELIRKAFEKNLKVESIAGTRLIQVQFLSPDPQVAADVVNTLVSDFIDQHFRTRFAATAQASDWLSKQLGELKSQAENSQAKVNTLKDEVGILGADETNNVVITRLDELNKQLVTAETNRILKQTVYQLTKSGNPELISATASSLATEGPGAGNPAHMTLIQNLRVQEATLNSQYAQANAKFGSAYPLVIQLRSEINEIDNSIQTEIQKLGARAENDYLAARKSEDVIRASFDQQKTRATEMNDRAVQYAILKRQADSDAKLYNDLLTRLKESGVLAGLRSTNIVVISPGLTSLRVASPNTFLFVGLGLAIGLLGGIALAFLREAGDDTVRTPAQIEKMFATPCVGIVPEFGSTTLRLSLKTSSVPIREAYHALRTWLYSSCEIMPRVIVITSALPEEGKTTTSFNIASVLAEVWAKVLLVEADLRRPGINKLLGAQQAQGLVDILSQTDGSNLALRCALVSNLHPPTANLYVLSAGTKTHIASQLLGSEHMKELLHRWRSEYDFIVIDTPPVLSFTDAVVVAQYADALLFVVRSEQTTLQSCARARELLERANVSIAGVIVNGADLDSPDYQHYLGYSHQKYQAYYHDVKGRSAGD